MSNTTANVVNTFSGTNFVVDVTVLNLSVDTNVKDFVVLNLTDPLVPTTLANSLFVKQTPTSIQYTGPALTSQILSFRRRTPLDPYNLASNRSIISSFDYNEELNRISRRAYELELNGVGSVGNVTGTIIDAAYSALWNGDTINAPSRNAVFDKLTTMDTATSSAQADIATLFSSKANIASPTFSGTPAAPTAAKGTNTTQLATAGFVQQRAHPLVIATATGAQSFAHTTPTAVQLTTESLDSNAVWNTSTGQFTAPYDGVYSLSAFAEFSANTGIIILGYDINAGTVVRFGRNDAAADSLASVSASTLVVLTAGQNLRFNVQQNSFSATARTLSNNSRFAIHYLGRTS
jgi:C1q domain